MPKHIDSVPKLADFRPPWITEDGTEVEIDKDKLKKYIHNLHLDKAKAQDARDEATEKVTSVETERDELKEQVDSKDPDASKKIAKAEKERDEAKAQVAEANARADRAEVAHEKGLTPAQAKRLQGETKDELEKDADEILELFGKPKGDPDDEDDEEDEPNGRTRPKFSAPRLTNGGTDTGADQEPDAAHFEKVAAEIQSRNGGF